MGVLDAHPSYLNTLMKMACAAELEALTPIKKIDSVPYFIHYQESFPYITHRLGETTLIRQASDFQQRIYTIRGRFVCGHVTGTITGQNEEYLYAFLPALEDMYSSNHYLTSMEYPDPLPEMSADPIEYRRDTGNGFFDNRGVGRMPNQVGFEFTVAVEITRDIRRKY